jgi:hypothetical protein
VAHLIPAVAADAAEVAGPTHMPRNIRTGAIVLVTMALRINLRRFENPNKATTPSLIRVPVNTLRGLGDSAGNCRLEVARKPRAL